MRSRAARGLLFHFLVAITAPELSEHAAARRGGLTGGRWAKVSPRKGCYYLKYLEEAHTSEWYAKAERGIASRESNEPDANTYWNVNRPNLT